MQNELLGMYITRSLTCDDDRLVSGDIVSVEGQRVKVAYMYLGNLVTDIKLCIEAHQRRQGPRQIGRRISMQHVACLLTSDLTGQLLQLV